MKYIWKETIKNRHNIFIFYLLTFHHEQKCFLQHFKIPYRQRKLYTTVLTEQLPRSTRPKNTEIGRE